ncbi:MAG: hypothetical protein IT158_01525 [Bryobacterales bacterium]|nr:hypothetical protein [Bryobacterales bacterium]
MKRHVYALTLAAGWLMLAAASPAAAEELRREGQFWVETVNGTEPIAPNGTMRIATLGAVSIKGGVQDQLSYSFTKKVRASNQADAKRQLDQFVLRASREGSTTTLRVAHGTGVADLQVTAPRTVASVQVETHGGSVAVADMNGAVTAVTGGGPIRCDRIGGEVVARTAGGEIALDEIRGGVRCESAGGNIRARVVRGSINCGTAGGEITIQEAGGPVRVSTAGGNIRIARAASTVNADTAGGAIDIGQASAMVRAETGGGPIDVGGANGVRCESAGGAIRLGNVTGSVRASTSVGAVLARLLAGGRFSDGFLSTGGGDITVFIPSNLAVTIRAQNTAVAQGVRRIVSDFDEVNVRVDGPLVVGEGSINGGGPVLRLAGSGGTIYIRRQR